MLPSPPPPPCPTAGRAVAGRATLAALVAAAWLAAPASARADEHAHHHPPPAAPVDGPDAGLAAGVSLEAVLERVLSRHPALHEASARTAAEQARAGAAGRLPAPALEAQLYQAPLDRPAEWGRANMLMLGVRQGLPPPGLREARARAARAVADAGREGVGARRLELAAQARKAFAAYAHAAREEEVHLQHVDLNQQIVSLARGRFEAGRMSKRDLLRTTYELARLHADVAGVEAQSRATRALLNTLMARDPDAPLGPPVASTSSSPSATAEPPHPGPLPHLAGREGAHSAATSTPPPEPGTYAHAATHAPPLAALDERLAARPDLVAAARRVDEREAMLAGERREAAWPELMVGATYGYMPVDGIHTYTLTLGATLPWLWGGRAPLVEAAARDLEAERRALELMTRAARYEVREAAARLAAAREQHEILDRELEPQARRDAEAARLEFLTGQGEAVAALEALHMLLTVRVERSRALLLAEEAAADLDRAAGLPPLPSPGARP
ncbi:MAG: TolC family protein [Anaeromyxobacter sp.]|nr:TolC family protein [Anaeromyxobacter sp.]